MSQIIKNGGGGGGGSSINEIDTQNGNATPIANIVIANGADLTDLALAAITATYSNSGIQTYGGVVGTGTQNQVDIVLPNHFHGSATTTDATPTTIATCPMSTNPATFQFEINLVAYDVTDNSSLTDKTVISFRTTGGVPVLLDQENHITQQDASNIFPAASVIDYNGSSTTFSVIVTGVAATTIKWLCHGTYTVVS